MADVARVSELQLDFRLYPRNGLDRANVRALIDALDMGAKLPPVIVRRGTCQVIDGFHRVNAVRERHSAEAHIAVEWRDYDTDAEAFEDAIRRNATHGLRIQRVDHEAALGRAQSLGLTPEAVSRALKVPITRLVTKTQTANAVKPRLTRPNVPRAQRNAWQIADERHDVAIGQALTDLSHRIASGGEYGRGALPDLMRAVRERQETGVGLRGALLDAAALFVCWAAREPRTEAEVAA